MVRCARCIVFPYISSFGISNIDLTIHGPVFFTGDRSKVMVLVLISFLAQPPVVVAILQIFIGCMLVVATLPLCLVIVRSFSSSFGASGKSVLRNCGIFLISVLDFLYKNGNCYGMYFKNCPTFVTTGNG